jgi:hypothetical protein
VGIVINNKMWVGLSCPHFYSKNRVRIKQLEQSLIGARLWGAWKDNIKNIDDDNPTEMYLDELFNNWQD